MNDTQITSEALVIRNNDIPTVDLGGETGMMHMNKEKYYGLNTVGSRIWELMQSPISVENIISALCTEFDVDEETCREQVFNFLRKLYQEDLIHVA